MNTGICYLNLFLLCATLFAQQLTPADRAAADAAVKQIRPQAIRAHVRFLTDSLLQGRATGTPGYSIAARYVATELEGMGLHPAGQNGTWFQDVRLRKAVVDEHRSSLVFIRNGKEEILADETDYVLSGDVVHTEASLEAPVVFAGFCVTAPDQKYDDYAGLDVKGKIVACLSGAPARFPSTERAYYSGLAKFKTAVAHGCVGMLGILTPEDQKRNPWAWLVPQIQAGEMRWLDERGNPHDAFPELRTGVEGVLLSQSGVEKLFAGAPKSLGEVFARSKAGQPQAFALPVTVHLHEVSKQSNLHSPNIVAELPGSDTGMRDQYVVYTAHVDHLGLCPPVNGDNVCHGARDNASGTASLLEIARAYSSLHQAPRRNILFLFVTGEEMGLLGSDYFAHRPTMQRRSIAANINIDIAPGLLYPMKDIVVLGIEHSSLRKAVETAAKKLGYDISSDPTPEEIAFIRSDQYSFVQEGVPAVHITDGVSASDPKIKGLDVLKKWWVTQYHTPLDNMNQPLNYESAARASGLDFLVGYEVAQQVQPPTWNPGDFFGTMFGPRHSGTANDH
jgi:Peptidase family M28